MRLPTKDTDYAVRALCYIAKQKDRLVSAAELVKALKIPRPFLRKILQALRKKGVLVSSSGQGGGFMLARTPDTIYMNDLVRIFQGPIALDKYCLKRECGTLKGDALRKALASIEKSLISEMQTITIASLADSKKRLKRRWRKKS